MPPEIDPMDNNPDLERALGKEGITREKVGEDTGPSYRVLGENKVLVSKHLGNLFSSRLDQAKANRKNIEANWSEAIRYYENDQAANREPRVGDSSESSGRLSRNGYRETENVVFANTTTMLPMLYAKNPSVEVTPTNMETNEEWGKAAEAFINKIFMMKTTPGVNLKQKARRGVLWAQLTNSAYMKVGWNEKADSSDQVIEDLRALSLEYQNAKSQAKIREVEGKIAALEAQTAVLVVAGLTCKLVSPFRIYRDPAGNETDLSDHNWVMEEDYIQTDLLNAVYGKKQEGKIVSVYEPSHVLNASVGSSENASTGALEDEVNSFSLFKTDSQETQNAAHYGYNSDVGYRKAKYTKVVWVWDKTTRRVYLYACNKWQWPVWVWEDPLKLLDFYPYEHLHFHESVEGSTPKGEVSYYLDQQDAINDNNATVALARDWNKNNVFFDNNVTNADDVKDVLAGSDGTVKGINKPPDTKWEEIIYSIVPPAMQRPELLDNTRLYAAINKITGITEAQQGAQFKTNTTNDAVNFYQKNVDIRVEEKIDAIEDWIGGIAWKLLQIAATKYTPEEVAPIIGETLSRGWRKVQSPEDIRGVLELQVVGGSTDKPTSKNKKRQAIEIVQALGQFGNGIPALGLVAVKVIERAFVDEITMTTADWKMLNESMNAQANAAGGGPGDAGGGIGAPGTPGAPDMSDPEVMRAHVANMIKNLSPQNQMELKQMVDKGMPPAEALKRIMEAQEKESPTSPAGNPAQQT